MDEPMQTETDELKHAKTIRNKIWAENGLTLVCGCFHPLVPRHFELLVMAHGVIAAVDSTEKTLKRTHACPAAAAPPLPDPS